MFKRSFVRRRLKYLYYNSWLRRNASFPYYGVQVHFHRGSEAFRAVCEHGIYESENLCVMKAFLQPHATVFDVGANIGLIAIPLLASDASVRVVSFEPSPNVLPLLQKTALNSDFVDRWSIIPKAVGAGEGKVQFSLSDKRQSLFDGIRPTHRVAAVSTTSVDIISLDQQWHSLGNPPVCLIKCDVEGAELNVLIGAAECLARVRPPVVLEWSRLNLAAYEVSVGAVLDFADALGYKLFSIPNIAHIATPLQLQAACAYTENFLLLPS